MTDVMIRYDPLGYALSPLMIILVLLAAALYWRGLSLPRRLAPRPAAWRQALFFSGLACILVATNAPLGPLGHDLFSAHQGEHLLLRLLGPLLIAVSRPWRQLAAALARPWRQRVAAVGQGRLVRWLAHPAAATATLIGALYMWQVPGLYGLAQRFAMIEVAAHLIMAAAGVWYFGVLLDLRDPPEGARRGARLMSGFVVIVSNILLGALTTLKESVIYAGHQAGTWPGRFSALADETTGGYIIWVPSSMIMIAAIILIINGWDMSEERRWNARFARPLSNSAALEFPETAEELRLKVAVPNQRMGRTLALGALSMFAIVMTTALAVLSLQG
ncbi:MAG: cytochrome c oxidase assembly protein [Candidatus Wenzhouxiangella sp. M2_3B_020]